ncbi:MAG: vWA domain-containing protein [Oligoflexus sp.]
MPIHKSLYIFLFLIALGCNSESGFNSGSPNAKETPPAGDLDATPEDQTPNTGNIENREIVAQESLVQRRNPLGAADSNIYSFKASQELSSEFRFSLDNQSVAMDFQLANNYSDRTENFQQINRTMISQNFQQGSPGTPINDMFSQEEKRGVVDILIVVDDSGSMSQEQKNLSDKLLDLLTYIDKTNWRIGFVTTSPKNNCQITLIPHNDPNAIEKFRTAAQPGIGGSGNEAGIKEAVNGLRCTENPWVRPDSTLAVLIVSDEDNCSKDGNGCRGEDWQFENYLIGYVEQTLGREVGKNAAFYGIFSSPNQPCRTAYNHAVQYQRLVDYKANGEKRWGDICDASYSSTLQKISENIASLLLNQWELTQTPDANSTISVEIEIDGARAPADPNGYQIQGRMLTFFEGYEPPAGSKIHVSYRVNITPMFNQVSLQEAPAANTLQVMVNGNMLNTNEYQLTGTTLVFNQRPAANAMIQVDYRRNIALKTEFTINGQPRNNQLQVKIQDVASNDFSYDPNTKILKLGTAPADNQKIVVSYADLVGPKLSYNLPLSGSNPRDFRILFNNSPINFERSGSTFTINAADHAENRQLRLSYNVDDNSEKTFSLPSQPIAGSVALDGMNSGCSLGNGFELVEQTLMARCAVRDLTEFLLSYKYLASTRRFEVIGLNDAEAFMWEVYIDGKATSEFQRQGFVIELNELPALGAQVDIYLTPLD